LPIGFRRRFKTLPPDGTKRYQALGGIDFIKLSQGLSFMVSGRDKAISKQGLKQGVNDCDLVFIHDYIN